MESNLKSPNATWLSASFILILTISIFLRLYKIETIPPGLNRDEAALGYNAYSILKTANDEYGKFLPLSFQSFGDWKLPLYIYSTIPFIAIFGLREFSVRFPSVIAGIGTIVLTYLTVSILQKELKRSPWWPILSMALLGINPWHLHFSRIASEANMAVFLTMLSFYLYVRGRSNSAVQGISLVIMTFTLYTYHGNHVFTPLFVLGCLGILKGIDLNNKRLWLYICVSIALTSTIIYVTVFGADKTKISGVGLFGNPNTIHERIEQPLIFHMQYVLPAGSFFHNKVIYVIETFAKNYIASLSPNFLFIEGGTNHAHNITGIGNYYIIEVLFFYLGIFSLLFTSKSKYSYFLLYWLFIAPLAPSITKDAPHSARMFAIQPIPTLYISLGILWFVDLLKNNKHLRLGFVTMLIVAYFANCALYFDRYYDHFPIAEDIYWSAHYKNLASALSQNDIREKSVVISNPYESPYIYLLFYTKYDPKTYQQESVRYPETRDGFLHVKSFGRYTFRDIDWDKDTYLGNTLLVGSADVDKKYLLPNRTSQLIYGYKAPRFLLAY